MRGDDLGSAERQFWAYVDSQVEPRDSQETPVMCMGCGVKPAQNRAVYFCVPCEDIEQAAAAKREYGVEIPLPNYDDPADVRRFCDAINALVS